MEDKLTYTADEVAEILHCSSAQVRRLIYKGEIKAMRPGQTWIVNRRELLRVIGMEDTEPAAEPPAPAPQGKRRNRKADS